MTLFFTGVLSIALAIIIAVVAIWFWQKAIDNLGWFKTKKVAKKPARKVVRKTTTKKPETKPKE